MNLDVAEKRKDVQEDTKWRAHLTDLGPEAKARRGTAAGSVRSRTT